MGALCHAAARPHGSNAVSRDWSMGHSEPYWQTNASCLVRGNQFPGHQCSPSDGIVSFFSNPSDNFQIQQWKPSEMQGVNADEYASSSIGGMDSVSSLNPNKKRMYGGDSTLHSDSKSIQMLSELLLSSGFPDLGTTPQREGLGWSSASSIDFTDVSEHLDQESLCFSFNLSEGSKYGLCERLLSQRSPWSSLCVVRSRDMPVAGVLSCWHVYHVDCLDKTTPKAQKHDPPCPLCTKSDNIQDKQVVDRLKNGISNVRSFGDNGSSRGWSCGQMGDCVEGPCMQKHMPACDG